MKNLYYAICLFGLLFFLLFGPTGASGNYVIWKPANDQISFTPNLILENLQDQNVIRDPISIKLIWFFNNGDKRVHAGPLLLDGNEWAWDIAKKLEVYRPYHKEVMIYEGKSLVSSHKDLCDLIFENHHFCKEKDFYDFNSGYLLGNTYKLDMMDGFSAVEPSLNLFEVYQKRFLNIINPIFSYSVAIAESKGITADEMNRVFTIASIIESEAKIDSEKEIVSGVIQNRINKNMKFEMDATVIFCFELSLDSNFLMAERPDRLFYKDLEIDCDYNTYKNSGLPPGPISAPGLAALDAAMNPSSHNYHFYVLERDGLHHYFSETYDEHLGYIKLLRGTYSE